jgi:class 3 adenylate cyclase
VQELEASRELIRGKNDELKKLFDQVVAERKVSERLALHVPPNSIAERLQARPDVTADSFADVTVLIADVVGFAELAPAVSPDRLALILEEIFTLFDGAASRRSRRSGIRTWPPRACPCPPSITRRGRRTCRST